MSGPRVLVVIPAYKGEWTMLAARQVELAQAIALDELLDRGAQAGRGEGSE